MPIAVSIEDSSIPHGLPLGVRSPDWDLTDPVWMVASRCHLIDEEASLPRCRQCSEKVTHFLYVLVMKDERAIRTKTQLIRIPYPSKGGNWVERSTAHFDQRLIYSPGWIDIPIHTRGNGLRATKMDSDVNIFEQIRYVSLTSDQARRIRSTTILRRVTT